MSFHKIVSVEVDEGFLQGLQIRFADHLTCVIGSRGCGKTTLLQFLRYVLNQPPAVAPTGDDKRRLDKNLKSGCVRIVVENSSGQRYVVQRYCNEPPKVFEESTARAIVEGWDDLFRVDYFTHEEITRVAEEPGEQLELLDSFVSKELAELEAQRATLERQLEQLAKAIADDRGKASEFQGVDEQITSNSERLAKLKPSDAALNALKEAAIAGQVARAKEADRLGRLVQILQESREELLRSLAAVAGRLDEVFAAEQLAGENGSILRPLSTGLSSLAVSVRATLEDLVRQVEVQQNAASTAIGQLKERHLVQDVQAEVTLRQDVEARERLRLEREQAELQAKQARSSALEASCTKALDERNRLVNELAQVVDRRTALRQEQVSRLNATLESRFGVKFELMGGGNTTAYRARLEGVLRGTSKQGQRGLRDIAAKLLCLEPRALARYVLGGLRSALAVASKLSEDQAAWVIQHLATHEGLLGIQATTNDDTVQLYFNVNDTWKVSQELSTGQKCSAVLPVLMLQADRPLIADEPEGHLDQRTLVERLVQQIRDMNGKRQLIIATHNPNIVTLGDDGDTKVVVLACEKADRAKATQGTVDGMRREIETLLEGGKEAFKKRGDLYARP